MNGDTGMGQAIAYFTSIKETVCIPLTDSQKYDLIVDGKSGVRRVQVKTVSYKNKYNRYEVALKVLTKRHPNTFRYRSKNDYDILFVFTSNGDRYLIPEKYLPKTAVALSKRFEKFKL